MLEKLHTTTVTLTFRKYIHYNTPTYSSYNKFIITLPLPMALRLSDNKSDIALVGVL